MGEKTHTHMEAKVDEDRQGKSIVPSSAHVSKR